jgi:putative FmdB family regulatory protein
MPIYEYEILEGDSCKACGGRFELRRPLDRPELTACPLCKKAVRKVITAPNTPKISKPLSVSDAKKAGFSVLKRRDKGVYERL